MCDWPGNVRELENTVERGMIRCEGTQLVSGEWIPRIPAARGDGGAAEILDVTSTTLKARMKKLDIIRGK